MKPATHRDSDELRVIWRFGDFELDPDRPELRRSGERVEIQRKPLELLIDLVRHRDRVVSKCELLDRIWPDTAVSESALASALRDLRRVVGDDGRRQETIRTHHCFGYRMVAEVEERVVAPTAPVVAELWSGETAAARSEAADGDWLAGFTARLMAFLRHELAAADDAPPGPLFEALARLTDPRRGPRDPGQEPLPH